MKLTKIALGVALAAGVTAAQADSLFFPFVVVSPSVTTLVSVIHHGGAVSGYDLAGVPYAGENLHWQVVYKLAPAANNQNCDDHNYYLPTSGKDIQTVDLGGVISKPGDYGVLFNDPSFSNNWRAVTTATGWGYDMLASATATGARAYLIVQDADKAADMNRLSGFAMVYDYSAGASWGYKADEVTRNVAAGDHNYVAAPGIQVHMMPFPEVFTRFFITPVNSAAPAQLYDNMDANFGKMATQAMLSADGAGAVAYNRDETALSGHLADGVICTGVLDVYEMLPELSKGKLVDGGWTYIVPSDMNASDGAVIAELEYGGPNTGRAGTLNGHPAKGAFNNAFMVE